MRVLVTGHKGYIGTVMVPMLRKAGHDVVGLDSDLYRNCTYGEFGPKVSEIIKDIRDVEKADLEGIDGIIHLAALSNDLLGNLNPELTYEINHVASVRLAAMAKELGINRYVFASSCSNYGAAGDGMQDESAELHPVTPYAISKVRVERDVAELADDNFSPVFISAAQRSVERADVAGGQALLKTERAAHHDCRFTDLNRARVPQRDDRQAFVCIHFQESNVC